MTFCCLSFDARIHKRWNLILQVWMTHFHTLLSLNNDLLKTDDDDEPGLMEELRSQICDNIGKSTLTATY